ncbi:uncharacterized protein FIBRA_04067 [Fibroporia radiculosa]|uniref:carnosine N-methyltransferase n=1 Tax=Fibroporia radiculosa TaxID=599839 RepID=J4G6T1_9APHY|nr:uncharacterized protein FIBRA_04067 [Fibroporia radiculosa]CCM01993.1 predicted protein [Fibroporia radiculosa]
MPFSEAEVEEERAHFANVVSTFQQYAAYSLSANNRRRKDFFSLPRADQELLENLGYKEKLAAVDHAILANAEFLSLIVADPEIFGHDVENDHSPDDSKSHSLQPHQGMPTSHEYTRAHSHSHAHGAHSHSHNNTQPPHPMIDADVDQRKRKRYRPTDFDMDKLRSSLKQFVRDWSEEGRAEREICYAPMREALLNHFSDIPEEERQVPSPYSFGNEFSHYMLLASYFVLNRTDEIESHTLYPYVHSFSNLPNNTAMLRPIRIPDVLPSSLPPGSNFSLVAGDFEEIYGAEDNEGEPPAGEWDAVLTCFFIDTAKNIVNYLRIIHRILAPGGVWINLGPLLWHFENNSTNDPSIELNLEEIKTLARKIGFEISNERIVDTTYTNNAQSMLGYIYHAGFWTATKVV